MRFYKTIKGIVVVFIIFLSCNVANAQSTVQWERCYGGANDEYPFSIVQGSDGNYIVAGLSRSTDGDVGYNYGTLNYLDVWVLKINPSDSILMSLTFGGTYDDYATGIISTNDGGLAICEASMSMDGDVTGHHGTVEYYDYWIIKTDINGNILWELSYGGSGDDMPNSIIQTYDGGYAIAGYSNSTDGDLHGNHNGSKDYWILKLDANGNIVWSKCYGGSNADVATSIIETYDHSLIVAGYSFSNDGDVSGNHGADDIWVIKLDENGNLLWQKSYGGSKSDEAFSVVQTLDSCFAIAGFTNSIDGDISDTFGGRDYWLLKVNPNGSLMFQKTYGGSDDDRANSLIQLSDGHYVLAGKSRSVDGEVTGNHGEYDDWIIETDSVGNLLWQESFGGNSVDEAIALLPTPDNGFVILSGAESSNSGDVGTNHSLYYDYWLIKMNFQDTAFVMKDSVVVYPNPSATNITLRLASFNNDEQLTINDVLGRVIYKETLTGIITTIDVSKWSRGVYFYKVIGTTGTYSGKIILLK